MALERPAPTTPHGVEQRPVLHYPQQLVGHCHVVGDGLLPIMEEGVGRPDLTGHQVVKGEDVHGTMET